MRWGSPLGVGVVGGGVRGDGCGQGGCVMHALHVYVHMCVGTTLILSRTSTCRSRVNS